MAVSGVESPSERAVLESVRLDDAWALVNEFSHLVRESGTAAEREAVGRITERLAEWGVAHRVFEPELLISLPGKASLRAGGRIYRAKTPSMAQPTPAAGLTASTVYLPTAFATSVNDIFAGAAVGGEVAGKTVVTEGLPMPGKIADLEARGAVGVICVAPGERIHEGICTKTWGAPDLATWHEQPRIPVVSVSNPDGRELIEMLSTGETETTIVAELETRWRTIPVTVAEIPGSLEPERFVLLHGHIDSWHVGIGDNATGDATLLEVARVLSQHRANLARTVRIAWWSGHSHGRYAGSTWYAQEFANDLLRNCICHINCDSPGCRDATVYEDVYWMAEVAQLAQGAIEDIAQVPAHGRRPIRAGDISFNNLGVSTFYMLSSTMPNDLRKSRDLYAVGGCGGNNEWHTEADTIEVADRGNLLRDMRVYAGATLRAVNLPVHPLDFRATIVQLKETLDGYRPDIEGLIDLQRIDALLDQVTSRLDRFYGRAASASSVEAARPFNDALLRMGRALVSVLYSRRGQFRQDPALDEPLLPEIAFALKQLDSVPAGVLRTELTRARNRIEEALLTVQEACEDVVGTSI